MMQTLKIKAPAKLNLYLKILAKRTDGFHDIETIFEKINLCDQITLRRRKSGIKIYCSRKDLPRDQRNLAARAAASLLGEADCSGGVEIRLIKNIPVAAGLGGGSSDAASVLLGLNRLFGLGLAQGRLLKLAQGLGADVPFFLFPHLQAIGRGRGDVLTSLSIGRKNWYVLVIPRGLAVSTRRMYQNFRMPLTKRPYGVKIVLRTLKEGNITAFNRYTYNSFEPALRKKYKEIREIKKALESSGVRAALMSGSGPCVFGIAQTRKEAMDISSKIRAKGENWQVIVAKTYTNRKSRRSK